MVRPSQRNYVTSTNTLCPIKTQRNSKKHKGSRPSDSKNAARERCRVENLRHAFVALQQCLPSVPPDTKLSKLDVLILATTYIAHLARILDTENGMGVLSTDFDLFEGTPVAPPPEPLEVKNPNWEKSYLHPVRKWPMRSRLYAGVEDAESSSSDVGLSASLFHRALWS